MSFSINEEKVNAQAVALEIARNEIMLDLEKALGLKSSLMNMSLLRRRLEETAIETKFEAYKGIIEANMAASADDAKAIKDYKVELYLRHFVLEAILENHYQTILELLKSKILNDLIKKFPLTTLVLEESTSALLGIFFPDEPVSFARKPIKNFLAHLNLTSNFDTLVTMIVAQIKFLECTITTDERANAKSRDLVMDNKYTVKVLEKNCGFVFDLALEFFKAITSNYHLPKYKGEAEMLKLERDFMTFVIEQTVRDLKFLGKLSPKSVVEAVNIESKRAWKHAKQIAVDELEALMSQNKYLTSVEKAQFKSRVIHTFKETVEKNFLSTFGFVPRQDVFMHHSYKAIEASTDRLLDLYYSRMFTVLHQTTDSLKFELNLILSMMLKSDTSFRFKYFPNLPAYTPDTLLPATLRKWIVVAAIAAPPKTFDPVEYQQLWDNLQSFAVIFEVNWEKEVQSLLELTKSIESRLKSSSLLLKAETDAEQAISQQVEQYGLKEVAYLLLGLYFLVTDGERDLLELRRAVGKNDIATMRPLNFKKRKLVIHLARYLKNGRFQILNFQLILLIETLIEKMRHTHNRFIASKVLKKALSNLYILDYNEVYETFRRTPLKELAKLLRGSPIKEQKGQELGKFETDFSTRFVSDLHYRLTPVSGMIDDLTMLPVDEELTIEKAIEGPILRKHGYNSPVQAKDSNRRVEDSNQDDLKLNGKLQYLKDSMKKFQFIDLQGDSLIKSRCPIICFSGFMSEDADHGMEWKNLVDLYPFTEIACINWEAFTIKGLISGAWDSLRKVSFKTLTDMMVDSLDKVIQSSQTSQANCRSQTFSQLSKLITSEEENQSIVQNPFEEGDQEVEGNSKPQDPEEREVTPRSKPSLWKLWRDNKLSTILSRETILKAALQLTKTQKKAPPKPMQAKALDDDDDDPDPERMESTAKKDKQEEIAVSPTEEQNALQAKTIEKYLPAFTITTGVYEFYRQNPFTKAYHQSVLAGQLLALMIDKSNLFNNNTVSLCGYSLGSVFAYSTCCTLYDLGCRDRIGDVCLLASCVDLSSLAENLHKLIGTKGVIQGKLTVVYSIYDSVLSYLFRSARVGEEPIGLKSLNRALLIQSLAENDPALAKFSQADLEGYLSMKLENVDASSYVGGHLDYLDNIPKIMQSIEFNSDLQFFKKDS